MQMQGGYYPMSLTPQRIPTSFETNPGYPSPSQQPALRPGLFHRRNERIDWRRIAAVDVDRIARDMDFQLLQDNLEQITFCNIDSEVDTRAMDPNFVKLYKMAQFTIEYLLACQEQISSQLVDVEQLKNRTYQVEKESQSHIEKLKRELDDVKKESKKRRKMIETQQRMLVAQNSNYHTCPVCTHAFLNHKYLQDHMGRRHPDYNSSRRGERDVDAEKEIQRLKEELKKIETELMMIKAQKAVDEEKIRDRDSTIRHLKEENQSLTTKITILDDRMSQMRTNVQTRSPSPHRQDSSISELIQENKRLVNENDQLKQALKQAEKEKKHYERENNKYQQEIENLTQRLRLLQSSGDATLQNKELLESQTRYEREKALRVKLEDQLRHEKQRLTPQVPSSETEHKGKSTSTVPKPASPRESPVQLRPPRPAQTGEPLLPQYCPNLVRRLNENPKILAKYQAEAKNQFVEEMEDAESLGILGTETRLTDLDYRTKMEAVMNTRRNIQNDLPQFERIREDISRTLNKLVQDRMELRHSISSIRSTGSKNVKFKDDKHADDTAPVYAVPSRIPSKERRPPTKVDQARPAPTAPTTNHYSLSDDDMTISNANESEEDTQPTRPGVSNEIRVPPRKTVPTSKPATSGVGALVTGAMRPTTTNGAPAAPTTPGISALVRPPVTKPARLSPRFETESEEESESRSSPQQAPNNYQMSLAEKKRLIEQRLSNPNLAGQKPGVSAIAQGFRPSQQALANQKDDDDDDDDDAPLTTIHSENPLNGKSTNANRVPQAAIRQLVNRNPLSSGEVSQNTYDSALRSNGGVPGGKVVDFRRPATADSAKTSNLGSDDDLDDEDEDSN